MPQLQEASSPPVEQLGIYRVESLLGQGGMGEVYLAWDELLQRRVAIKRIRTDRLGDETQRLRFLREARAVARLDHPSIVRVHHILERDDSHCLVMEHIQGQDLAKMIADGLVSLEEAAVFGRDIAAGLAAAHDQGLVHRDLKPANVMIVDQDSAGTAPSRTAPSRIKILDFGLAKSLPGLAEVEGEDELTVTDMIVGTAHAMSPEQASGGPVDHRSDLFALGSLLYELLTGKAPFRGASAMDSLRRVLTEEPEPITKLLPQLHADLAGLVTSLLRKDPSARPASAHRVAERLAEIANVLGTEAPEPEADADSPTAELPPVLGFPSPPGPPSSQAAASVAPVAESGPVLRTVVQIGAIHGRDEARDEGEAGEAAEQSIVDTARALLTRFNAQEAQGQGGFLFQRPAEAVAFALLLHQALAKHGHAVGVGVHLGEVDLPPATQGAQPVVGGQAPELAAALARRARSRQTLLGRTVFDLVRGAHSPGDAESAEDPLGGPRALFARGERGSVRNFRGRCGGFCALGGAAGQRTHPARPGTHGSGHDS